jgi:uncharacterized protein
MDGRPDPLAEAGALRLEEKVRFLGRPENHLAGTDGVEVVETHMAFVFLTDRFAYKMKKPVQYPLLDFSTLEARRQICLEEVRLNRRLAPDVYLGAVPLTRGSDGRLGLNGEGEAVEWLVWMQRLRRSRMLDRLISPRGPGRDALRPSAELLGAFYRDADPVASPPAAFEERFRREVGDTESELRDPAFGLPEAPVREVTALHRAFLDRRGSILRQRAGEGRIVEGHGDLRAEHVYLGSPPAVIDCLEFNRDLRTLDPTDDLSFLWLECERLGNPLIGEFFLQVYSRMTGDRPGGELLHFYRGYRAFLRAKLAVWHLRDHGRADDAHWRTRALEYLDLSRHHLQSALAFDGG